MKIFVVIIALFLFSCQSGQNKNQNNESQQPSTQIQKSPEENIIGCYVSVFGRDTSILKITSTQGADSVKGTLLVNLYEKDKNEGTFVASVKDGMLSGWYNFQSEGMNSVRQILYKVQSDTLFEGYGPVNEKGDSVLFKEISGIKFLTGRPLVKGDCK